MARGNTKEILLKIYNKRIKLLDMPYTTSELAETLDLPRRFVTDSLLRVYSIPSEKDSTDRIYINGNDVKKWIESMFAVKKDKEKRRKPLLENEFYCMKCRQRIFTDIYSIEDEKGALVKISKCPECGARMRKYIKGEKYD